MRTLGNIAETCLDYTDVDEAAVASATTRQKKFLCSIITGAMQELHVKRPEAFRQRVGFTLAAPESGEVIVSAGSTNVDLSAFGRDLRGMTFRAGDTLNQVKPAASSPGTQMLLPWTGSTGATNITVYGDAILIGTSAFNVMGDVHLEGYGPLKPLADRAAYTAYRDDLSLEDYGMRTSSARRRTSNGQPEAWWTEAAYLVGARSQLYLRFAPLPEREYQVSFDLTYLPRELEPADLEDEDLELPIPGDFYDAILIPFVLQRWTGSPWFRNSEAKEEIGRQWKVAQAMLADWGPQLQGGANIVVAAY